MLVEDTLGRERSGSGVKRALGTEADWKWPKTGERHRHEAGGCCLEADDGVRA